MKYIVCIFMSIFAITANAGWFGPSDAEKKRAQTQCEKFVKEKVAEFDDETHVFDTYTKSDKIVVEVGYREGREWKRRDKSYSVRVCVYDEKQGTIMLPSLLNMGEWRK